MIGPSSPKYPYVPHMHFRFGPLEIVEVQQLADACTDAWYNQTLCEVNDSVVRLGILQGEYHWHQHEKEDEFFFVLEGQLIIDLEDHESIQLNPQQGFVVPKGVVHKPKAPAKTVVLMMETAGIIPTGDA